MDLIDRAQPHLTQATALAVISVPARQRAADLWDAIRAFRKQAEAQKETTCRPLKTAWDEAKIPFDSFIKECQGHETALSQKMNAWDREQQRRVDLEQAKIQARIDAQNTKAIERAEAKGVEPVLRQAPIIQTPPKSIKTQAGTTQTRHPVKRWTISGLTPEQLLKLPASDPRLTAVPRECLIVDPVRINALIKLGVHLTCITVHDEYVYAQH